MEKIPFLQVINSEKHKVAKDLERFSTPFPFLEAEVTDIIPGEKFYLISITLQGRFHNFTYKKEYLIISQQ